MRSRLTSSSSTTSVAIARRSVMAHRKRLIRTFAYICTHPKDWHQGAWRCNSGMCFAGHAAVTIAGREPLVPAKMLNDDFVDANDLQELVLGPKFGFAMMLQERIHTDESDYEIPNALKPLMRRKTATMNDEAREYLGLTSTQDRKSVV